MIAVVADSSVWIDLLTDRMAIQTIAFRRLLEHEQTILMGDLVLTEILQGTRSDAHFRRTMDRSALFEPVQVVDRRVAVDAAQHYRFLRAPRHHAAHNPRHADRDALHRRRPAAPLQRPHL